MRHWWERRKWNPRAEFADTLKRHGYTLAHIGRKLGVSKGRAQQLADRGERQRRNLEYWITEDLAEIEAQLIAWTKVRISVK